MHFDSCVVTPYFSGGKKQAVFAMNILFCVFINEYYELINEIFIFGFLIEEFSQNTI